MPKLEADICVIGAGSGGLSVAAGAAQMGARVVLIEGHRMGGDCLNYGCVPSKALIAAAKRAHALRTAGLGVVPVEPQVDYGAAMGHVEHAIAAVAPHDSQERFEALGVTVIRDWARFTGPDAVVAVDTEIRARRFVVATGSSPLLPPIPGLAELPYLTNESLFDLRDRPAHLIVIGGGPIGLEMAQAHRRLGSQVTVIEAERALGKDDPEAAAVVLDRLRTEGIEIVEGQTAERVEGRAGEIAVVTQDGTRHAGSHLLVAAGRRVNIERLDLGAANVAYDRGVTVGPDLRSTTNRRVYVVGDAAGGMQFTHVAGYHAGIVIRSALLGLPAKAKTAHLPWTSYTDPELAQVGLTEAQARGQFGARLDVVRADYAGNDRAVAMDCKAGFLKVMVARGRPVGATIVGAEAGELISLWSLAIANSLKMSAVSNAVLPYPTLSELSKRAAGAYFSPKLFNNPWVGRAVRLVQRIVP